MTLLLLFIIVMIMIINIICFIIHNNNNNNNNMITKRRSSSLSMSLSSIVSNSNNILNSISMSLADTSISEDDILEITGQASNLPDPIYTIGLAGIILIGTLVLQFSLGDLTKEEGQARVRDFLQTRRETERRRGYFDSPGERRERPTDEI